MHISCSAETCFVQKMTEIFALKFHSHLPCTRPTCDWTSNPPPEPSLDISVAVRPSELQSLLADFEMPEFLAARNDYSCRACEGLVQKTLQIQPIGRALLLHLKRFDNNGRKLIDAVQFPRELIFGTARYKFAAVIEHQGETMRSGHYVAHVQSAKLLYCSDEHVTETTWEHVAAKEAYMLAYVLAES